jgi:BNR/Asp-box repeat
MKMRLIAVLMVVFASLGLRHSADAVDLGDRDGEDRDFMPPVLEADITGNGSGFLAGEPEIAVNPVQPGNLFIDYTVFPVPTPALLGGPPTPTPCGGMASRNDGRSWQPATVPLPGCADAIATFGPDGALYAGGLVSVSTTFFPTGTTPPPGCLPAGSLGCVLVTGFDAVLRSTDGGQTWSDPVKVMGTQSLGPFPFAPGSGNPVGTFDRPFVVVDQSTNIVYLSAQNIANHERFVSASTNGGQSFGTIYAVDSATFPQAPTSASNIVAAKGLLAVAYVASQAPGAACPCLVFETSANRGATFTRHLVPLVNALSTPHPFVAAFPEGGGRFAVTVLDSTGTTNQVYVTSDFGQTWRGPTLVAEAPANPRLKPWITYGSSGQIALVWRTRHSDGSIDVWSAVGRDEGRRNGAQFSPPLRVSSVASTPPPGVGAPGDDFSWVIVDNRDVHVGWGDSRNRPLDGGIQTGYARIPFGAFEGDEH